MNNQKDNKKQRLWDFLKLSTTQLLEQLMSSILITSLVIFYTSNPKKIKNDLDEYSKTVKEYDPTSLIHKSIIGLRLGVFLSSGKAFTDKFSSEDFIQTLQEFEFVNLSLINLLITLYTIFESFLGITFDIIGELKPNLWKKKKLNISRIKIEKLLLNNELNKHFIEKYQYDMSIGTIKERFKKLKKWLDLPYSEMNEIISELDKFKAIRDIYIHNNGFVNKKFKDLVETNLKIKEKYPITYEYLMKISDIISQALIILTALIAIKLDITEDEYSKFIGIDRFNHYLKSIFGKEFKIKFLK